MKKKKLFKWLKIVALVYVAGAAALYFLQDAILFHPVSLKRSKQFAISIPHKEISIPINSTDTLNLVRFLTTDTLPKGIVLYFHGNKKNIEWYAKFAPNFTKNGYEVIMIDYPGFGKSTGKLTEKILYDWANQAYELALTKFSADKIIVYGKSMGTGIAAHLASIKDCQRLVLETPYYDFPSVLKNYLPIYPIKLLLHYELPTYKFLPYVTSPVTIFHGTDDWIVPYKNTKKLVHFLKSSDEVITIAGGSHNNLYDYQLIINKIDSLLSK